LEFDIEISDSDSEKFLSKQFANLFHHGFCKNYEDWPYSSYSEILQGNPSGIETTKLLKMTSGLNGFIQIHQRFLNTLDNKNDPDIPLPI
jgi:hypothetical protein